MPPAVIDLTKTDDTRDVVHRAVQALAEDKLVVFPTETVYVIAASALHPSAVQRLVKFRGQSGVKPFTLALRSSDEALDYVPAPGPLAERLARRCWPGPLTLVLDASHPDSIVQQLPPSVQDVIRTDGSLALRVPAHHIILAVQRLCAGPLVIASAARSGEPDPVTAEEVLQATGDEPGLVLVDGRCRFGQPATVVRVDRNKLKLLRPGVFSEASLRQLCNYMLLFVCTGNTCRSPMAESMMRSLLAQRLGVSGEQLEQRGLMVMSAGISAMSGSIATPEAVAVVGQRGCDLKRHESQPLTERLIRFADLILTMTRGHREAILSQWPSAAGRIHLLCRDGSDIADPIGGPLEMYERCALQIESQLKEWLEFIDLSLLPPPGAIGD